MANNMYLLAIGEDDNPDAIIDKSTNHKSNSIDLFFASLLISPLLFFGVGSMVWGIYLAISSLFLLGGITLGPVAITCIVILLSLILLSMPCQIDCNAPDILKLIAPNSKIRENIIVVTIIGLGVFPCAFFIAIACGAPAIIATSYLSWSALNIALLITSILFLASSISYLISSHCSFSSIKADSAITSISFSNNQPSVVVPFKSDDIAYELLPADKLEVRK